MNRSNFWKLTFVVLTVLWSVYEIYPPTGRDLAVEFRSKAVNQDDTFKGILGRLDKLQQQRPARPFANIVEAVGTNDIINYFPYYEAKSEENPTRFIVNRLQRDAAGKIKLGLDLQGGTSFLVEMDTSKLSNTNEVSGALSQAVEVLRKRVDRFGVAEPLIQPAGNNRILVQLPGLSDEDRERAKSTIQRAAFLEFRMVHDDSKALIEQNYIEPGYEILQTKGHNRDGSERVDKYLVKRRPEMTGQYVKSAMANRDPVSGKFEINFTLTSDGAELFGKITRENIKKQLAIVLDGALYSAPVIQSAIETGSGQITGDFTIEEALSLANVLENPLKAQLSLISSDDVDPSLGRDSIHSGLKAAIIGTIAVAGFMLVYYLFAGLVANIALMLNIVILLGVMCSIDTTLTLPGIAGVVLTIGMAVDANVLIFERIREELAKGKSLRGALQAGYARAFGTIFDSHVTTLISSVILIFMGTGPVKGFGVTLTIGVAASLFTALVVTRLIFDWLLNKGWIKTIRLLQFPFLHGNKWDFMKWALPAFICSWTLIFIGNGWGFHRGHDVLGVDFAGGDAQTLEFAQRVPEEKLRNVISQVKHDDKPIGEATVQYQKGENNIERLRVTTAFKTADDVAKALNENFPEAKFNRVGLSKVGAVVGQEIQQVAVVASLLAMFGILIYVAFRYEFSFALGAVIAIIHDILMTMGWFFLTGRQLNAPIVAAILTIIGFSINDTIVIFDRIREDLKLGVRGTFKEVMNQALNQTLSRTIITSGTVFLSTMSLYLFGGTVINDFAFTFLIGILTGTYSSIYIASAFVLWWHKGERPKTGSQVALQEAASAGA